MDDTYHRCGLLGHRVKVVSRHGQGSVFSIDVRLASDAALTLPSPVAAAVGAKTERPAGLRRGTILVVEDEAIIRMDAIQMLEDAGFATVEAGNADDAIRILEFRSDIRAVFTDINMPGTLDGMRMAHLVRGRWPPIHLIVTSGLNSPSEQDLPVNGRFIRKPYRPEHVIAILRELLDQSPFPAPLRKAG